MTVWEKIEQTFKDVKGMTKEKFIKKTNALKITSCDIQYKYYFAKEEDFKKLCSKYTECCNSVDARRCLEDYLDLEVVDDTNGEGGEEDDNP